MILIIISVLFSACSSSPSKSGASVAIQEFVTAKLLSPSTADFPFKMVGDINQIDDNTFDVHSYVDSQNAFGGVIRTNFYCKVRSTEGNNKWICEALDFQ